MKFSRALTLLGGAAVAAFAVFAASSGTAQAETAPVYETCGGGACLVMGPDNPATWTYGGFRPFFDQWVGTQDYNVEDGSTLQGSYNISVSDTYSVLGTSDVYTYGAFTPAAGVTSPDLGDFANLSGTKIYETIMGSFSNITITEPDGPYNFDITKFGDFTNVMVTANGYSGSEDYVINGAGAPSVLYDSLWNPGVVAVPNDIIPADPWAGADFDPSQYLAGAVAG